MNGDCCHRLNRAGKAQILAEAQHGFHAGIRAWSKIHVGQQLAAVRGRLFHGGRDAFAALAKGSLLPGGHQAGLQFGCAAGAVGNHYQGSVFQPAQQGTVSGRAQGPCPVVLLCVGVAWLGRQPLHYFVQRVQGEVHNSASADTDVFTKRGQERRAHRLNRVAAGKYRWYGESAVAVGVDV